MTIAKRGYLLMAVWLLVSGLGAALQADPYTPQPGTSERREILDTLRPTAVAELGGPIEFVVNHLLVDGEYALAFLHAQRPGGVQIDLAQTPLHLRDGEPLSLIDGPMLIAFLNRQSGTWQRGRYCIGCTDALWAGLDCENYAAIYDIVFRTKGVCER